MTSVLLSSLSVLLCFFTGRLIRVSVSGKRSKLGRSEVAATLFQEDTFIDIDCVHCFLIVFIESFVVGHQHVRGQKIKVFTCFDDSLHHQLAFKVIFKIGRLTGINVHGLYGEHL